MDRIHQVSGKVELSYEPENFCLRGKCDEDARMNLANAYKDYCAADDDSREFVIKVWLRGWLSSSREIPDEFADAKPDLLAVVWSRFHFECCGLERDSSVPIKLPYKVLGEHFGVGIVYDWPESMWWISQANLDAWGITFDEALEAAMQNLFSREATFLAPDLAEGVYASATDDDYDASRLLVPDAIRQFTVKGHHIAVIPNRNNLIVTGSDDVAGLASMAKLAAKAMEEHHGISGIALRLDGDEWTPWMPPSDHPAYKDFQRLQLQSLGHEYAQQKDMLDKLHKKHGENVFVASLYIRPAPDGRLLSLARWAADADTMLPKTDTVAFIGLGEAPTLVEWQKAVDVVGDLMEPLDIYPPRYRVREFPSETQLASMGNMLEVLGDRETLGGK